MGRDRSGGRQALVGAVALWVALLLVLLASVAQFNAIARLDRAQADTERTTQLLLLTERLYSALKDAETGQRGFLLTLDRPFQQPYRAGTAETRRFMAELRAEMDPDPAEQPLLNVLERTIAARLDQLDRTVSTAEAGRVEQALAIVRTGEGRRLMDEARGLLERLRDRESRQLAERVAVAEEAAERLSLLSGASGLLAVGSLGTGALLLGRRTRRERAAAVVARDDALERLGESEARYRILFEAVPLGVVVADPLEVRILAANPAAEALLGYPAGGLVGASLNDHVADRTLWDYAALVRDGILDGGTTQVQVRYRRLDGEVRDFLVTRRPVALDGRVLGLGIWLDVTGQMRDRQALADLAADLERRVEDRTARLAEVNAELETYARSVSHDLRAPLRGMEGYAAALLEDFGDSLPPQGRRYAERIMAAATSMDGLIQGLLAYSRVSQGELETVPVPLGEVARVACQDLAASIAAAGAEVTVAPGLPTVRGDPGALRQVLGNLVGNAIKFVAPGVSPRVRLWAERRTAGWVRFWVEDNGIGVPLGEQDRVFQAFQRLHGEGSYPGSGLGLAIVAKAARRMGGACGVEPANPGPGSRFWIDLPGG